MLMRPRTMPQTNKYGRSQRFTKCLANCLSRFLASKPKRPSVDITNGEKERRCWRHSSRYFFFFFFFFCCSWLTKTLAGSLVTYAAASRSVTWTSMMQSLSFFQRLLTKRSHHSRVSVGSKALSGLLCLVFDGNFYRGPTIAKSNGVTKFIATKLGSADR